MSEVNDESALVGMRPGTAKGTVGQTTQVVCEIGAWLAGRTIDRILIAYDNVAKCLSG